MIYPDTAFQASQHLMKLRSKKLCDIVRRTGPIYIPDRYGNDPLMGLCQIVVSQQLSNQAARSIWTNVCNLFPDRVERLSALKNKTSKELGLSNAKQHTLKLLLEHGDNWLRAQIIESQKVRYHALTNLWGIGPWSVAMWELFVLRNPDIWADGDLILKRISGILADETEKTRLEWIDSASPYRSFLALYCWKLKDD